jgi:hypothetical protein
MASPALVASGVDRLKAGAFSTTSRETTKRSYYSQAPAMGFELWRPEEFEGKGAYREHTADGARTYARHLKVAMAQHTRFEQRRERHGHCQRLHVCTPAPPHHPAPHNWRLIGHFPILYNPAPHNWRLIGHFPILYNPAPHNWRLIGHFPILYNPAPHSRLQRRGPKERRQFTERNPLNSAFPRPHTAGCELIPHAPTVCLTCLSHPHPTSVPNNASARCNPPR